MIQEMWVSANSNWFELARHDKEASELGRKPHIGASNAGPKFSSLPSNGHPNTLEDSFSSEDETRKDTTLRKRTKRSNLADEIPSSTTPPNWDDCPAPVPLQPALPVQHVDADACSTSARIAAQPDASVCSDDAHTAAQYPEEQGQCVRYRQEQVAMQVESTGFPIQNVESTQSNSIQTAYAPAPVVTQQPRVTTLRRRSNVDGNFYSHEFDHEEVMEMMSESRSQISSVDEPWNRVFEAPKRVYPTPNGSLRERTLPSVRVQELAEPVPIPSLHSSKGSLRERARPSARIQKLVEPFPPRNGSLRECTPPGMCVQELAGPRQMPNGSLRER